MTLINADTRAGSKMTEKQNLKDTLEQKVKRNTNRDNLKSVGRRICTIRNNYTLTQQQMADKLLISRNYLSELENGRRVPPGPILVALEAVFMANREWISNGSGEMLKSSADKALKARGVEHEDIVELLKGFRTMSSDGRKKLMNIMRIFIIVENKERQHGNS